MDLKHTKSIILIRVGNKWRELKLGDKGTMVRVVSIYGRGKNKSETQWFNGRFRELCVEHSIGASELKLEATPDGSKGLNIQLINTCAQPGDNS